MSEKKIRQEYVTHHRNCMLHRTPDEMFSGSVSCSCGLAEALAKDPDVVGLLRWLVGQTLLPNCTAASAWIFNFVAERIREEFHVCLIDEPPGWEWV